MTRALVALVALALALPATAVAKPPPTNAPPGNSAIDQYLETVPGPSGNTRPRPPGQGGNSGALTPAQRARLERLGPDGQALASAVDQTSPKASGKKGDKKKTVSVPQGDGQSPADKVLATVGGSDGGDGMGIVLPAILIATLLAAIVFVLLRRRGAS